MGIRTKEDRLKVCKKKYFKTLDYIPTQHTWQLSSPSQMKIKTFLLFEEAEPGAITQ